MVKKILVVDDEPDILKVIIFRLQKDGFEVKTASEGHQAMEIVRAEKFDLVLLDITLPGLNGYEICSQIKADENLKPIPVLFITASTPSEGFQERVEQVNANGYVFKPFDYDALLEKIKEF
ncbi:MAG: response regulator [Candidatus Aceula meridiana]|nr:response regulator [Candidatus Aceula meridiana]